jgi:hypothetical protein
MSLQRTVGTRTLETCIEGINEFKRDYQPRSNLVKNENGDLLADSHNILNRWKNYVGSVMLGRQEYIQLSR